MSKKTKRQGHASQSSSLSAGQTFAITVEDVAPTVTLGSNVSIAQGTSFERLASFSSPTPGAFTAAVDYGDGAGLQPLILSPSGSFTLSDSYAEPGTFTVTVAVTDPFGLVGSQTLRVVVAAVPSGFGAGRDAFVTTLYTDVLGRLPELTTGLDFWSGVLAKGVKPKTVIAAIWNSPEHRSLVRQHVAPGIPFMRSFSDALFAGFHAARLHRTK